eukprot:Skav229314  [mRNA]  locus=scaffold2616:70707:70934:+ [translate_table: standard]
MEPSRSSALVGLCATGGAVAVLGSAGLVPAVGLLLGLGGGWLLGQKLKGQGQVQKQQAKGTSVYGSWRYDARAGK